MEALHHSESQQRLLDVVLAELGLIGYRGDLVEKNYRYPDRFAIGLPERRLDAALFGRSPASYETALFGIAKANGTHGATLANEHRSLCAPLFLEVQDATVGVWTIGRAVSATQLQFQLDEVGIQNWVARHAKDLRPQEFLRTKELEGGPVFIQGTLFAGLIPELEEEIGKALDPLLKSAFSSGINTYKAATGLLPAEPELFKLTFWLLTGKVFSDRGHPGFVHLRAQANADEVLTCVARHYNEYLGGLLNKATRDNVFKRIWSRMDFRHLSVEVLSQIWSRTLVTPETRKRLGIHRTRKSIVRYIVDQIPFEDFATEDRQVLEPCTGSAAFLVGALDRMRDIDDIHDPNIRHAYFQRMLKGIESDPFGVEIGRLCLALADYPNPNGWKVMPGDVFEADSLAQPLSEARIVLCNPPFEKFGTKEKKNYNCTYWFKPAELLSRVLGGLHPEGVIGFVMPRSFLDGQE